MSQFRDTFTKDEQRESLLDYDDNAFMFFLCSITICGLAPWTIFFLKRLFGADKYRQLYPEKTAAGSKMKHCSCSLCLAKQQRMRSKLSQWKVRLFNRRRLLELVALIISWIIWISICINLQDVHSIKTFDPFEILDVGPSATKQEIKKAYRLMSLKYHPDKNINDPTTGAKFILIAKAYQTLTDEVAKQNYEKYGNPDGPGGMKIGVGLPQFLVDEKNQLFVLAFFFLFLLVILPMIFLCYYQRQKKFAPNGVMVETVRFLTHCMTESSRIKNFPEYLAASGESRMMKICKEDDEDMRKICDIVSDGKKRMFTLPIIVRNYYLLLAHMQRLHNMMSNRLLEELQELLKSSLRTTHCMMEISLLSDWFHTASSVLEFRRCLIQGIDSRNASLLQIPHFNDEIVRHCHRGKHGVRDLSDFLKQNIDERKGIVGMTPEQQEDVQSFCAHVANISLDANVVVEDETDIVVGDVATCTITMTRNNLQPGEAAGAVHCPLVEEAKYEEWWFFLIDKGDNPTNTGRILNFVWCTNLERVVKERLQFRVGRPGKNYVSVVAMCDSYASVDTSVDVQYKVYTPAEMPREVYVHPEDIGLDEEPTLFQQMLGDMTANSSEDEETFELDDSTKLAVRRRTVTQSEGSKTVERQQTEADSTHEGDEKSS